MYFIDGQIAERGNLNKGTKVGEWITYNSDGSVQSREMY
jgi:antitoxin component YwqK of YwqJK toxin-antitoxin module